MIGVSACRGRARRPCPSDTPRPRRPPDRSHPASPAPSPFHAPVPRGGPRLTISAGVVALPGTACSRDTSCHPGRPRVTRWPGASYCKLTPSILPCAERDLAAFLPHAPLLDPPRSVPMPRIRHRRRLEPAIRPEARRRGGAPSRRACVNLSYSTLSPKKPSVAASSRIVRAENRSKRRYAESCCGRRELLNVTHQAEKGIAQGPRLVL